MQRLHKTLDFARLIVGQSVTEGDTVIDATAGNGHDTLYLAVLVGEKGRVYSFDIQEKAIQNTWQLLQEHGLSSRAYLVREGHEQILEYVKEDVSAVMFNLGYLPGSDHSIITRPETTLKGFNAATTVLSPGGVITMVVYTGHSGGKEEWHCLEPFVKNLDKKKFRVLLYKFLNTKEAPFLIAVEKL